MFIVFTDILITDKGKALVREYYNTGNAHQIYAGLVIHAATLTKLYVESAQLSKYINSAKLRWYMERVHRELQHSLVGTDSAI